MTRYWFKPKSHGYGATPVTWEGWTLVLAGVAIVLVATMVLLLGSVPPSFGDWMVWAMILVVTVSCLVVVSHWKTDGVWRWRWG